VGDKNCDHGGLRTGWAGHVSRTFAYEPFLMFEGACTALALGVKSSMDGKLWDKSSLYMWDFLVAQRKDGQTWQQRNFWEPIAEPGLRLR
jgi:hypothetical protein